MGRRMKSYGPKPLISLRNNTTIFKNQLKIIDKLFDSYRIIIVSGFEADRLMSEIPSGIVSVENEYFSTTNVVRSIGIGLRATVGSHVIVCYGDLVFNREMMNNNFDESCLLIDGSEMMCTEEVGCIVQDGYVRNVSYDLPTKWGQIFYATGNELALLKDVCWDRKNNNKFGFEAINQIIDRGGLFKAIKPRRGKVVDVDRSSDIELAKTII